MIRRRFSELSDDDCSFMLREAVEHYSAGRFEPCERILRGLLVVDPGDTRPWKLLGSTFLFQDRRREARAAYEQALALEPDDPYTLVGLAEIALDAMRIDEGVALLERLFALDPDGRHPAVNRGRQVLHRTHARLGGG